MKLPFKTFFMILIILPLLQCFILTIFIINQLTIKIRLTFCVVIIIEFINVINRNIYFCKSTLVTKIYLLIQINFFKIHFFLILYNHLN